MENKIKAGIFYDGYHVYKRLRIYHKKQINHFNYQKLNHLIEEFILDSLNINAQLVCKNWYQGMKKNYVDIRKLRDYIDLKMLHETIQKYHDDHLNHFKTNRSRY